MSKTPEHIIGVAGTNGSGKDLLGEYLEREHGYLSVSVSDLLRDEARKRGLPIERDVLRNISAEWRREYGLGVLVDRAVEKAREGSYKGVLAIPMRNPGEAKHVHELGGVLIWVDADPRIRYERIFSRQRSAEDRKTFEQFIEEEQAEMQHSGDEATLSLAGVKKICDIFIENNGNDVAVFEQEVVRNLEHYSLI